MSIKLSKEASDRFWAKVEKTDGCWIWRGYKNSRGYGAFSFRYKENGIKKFASYRAHRIAYELLIGEIADGYVACHKCDNPSCVNPDHIFIGTSLDNYRDCMSKGRARFQNKKFCKNGHERSGENVIINGNKTICKLCQRIWDKKKRDKIKNDPEKLIKKREYAREIARKKRSSPEFRAKEALKTKEYIKRKIASMSQEELELYRAKARERTRIYNLKKKGLI